MPTVKTATAGTAIVPLQHRHGGAGVAAAVTASAPDSASYDIDEIEGSH
jgi:hypothetical protein